MPVDRDERLLVLVDGGDVMAELERLMKMIPDDPECDYSVVDKVDDGS